jgi:hypothetical protein
LEKKMIQDLIQRGLQPKEEQRELIKDLQALLRGD